MSRLHKLRVKNKEAATALLANQNSAFVVLFALMYVPILLASKAPVAGVSSDNHGKNFHGAGANLTNATDGVNYLVVDGYHCWNMNQGDVSVFRGKAGFDANCKKRFPKLHR